MRPRSPGATSTKVARPRKDATTCEYGYPEACGEPAEFRVTAYEPTTNVCRQHLDACAPPTPWGVYGLTDRARTAVKEWQAATIAQ